MIDVTSYDDIQELLLVSDMLITDYSSLMFDYAETRRPCFLYAPDIEEYQRDDRKFYFKLKDLPFPVSTTQNELLAEISSFKTDVYISKLNKFMTSIGSYEDGDACRRVISHIESWIDRKNK